MESASPYSHIDYCYRSKCGVPLLIQDSLHNIVQQWAEEGKGGGGGGYAQFGGKQSVDANNCSHSQAPHWGNIDLGEPGK